ncbi:TPA: hypothetical protein WME46_002138, partial [Neisseria gonorrhoeae]
SCTGKRRHEDAHPNLRVSRFRHKRLKHGIRHKRHGCRRGGTSVFQRGEDGKPQRVSRIRKRSATPGQAKERTKTHDVSRTQQP